MKPSAPSAAPPSRTKAALWTRRSGIGLVALATVLVIWRNLPHAPSPAATSIAAAPSTGLDAIQVAGTPFNEEMQIRQDLRAALGRVPGTAPQQRLDLLTGIRGTLAPVEANALFHELLEPRPPTVNEGWNSVYMQNMCLVLREQPAVRETFARVLATLVRDVSRDAVIRDYAVQHLRQVWDRAGEQSVLRASIEKTFHDLVTGSEPAMAATGLLSLHLLGTRQGDGALTGHGANPAASARLSAEGVAASSTPAPAAPAPAPHYEVPDAQLAPLVESLLKAPPTAANLPCRLTAIRVISDRRLESGKAVLRQVAVNTTTEHTLARMAAIAALGRFQDPSDKALFASLDKADGRIAAAVKTALGQDTH